MGNMPLNLGQQFERVANTRYSFSISDDRFRKGGRIMAVVEGVARVLLASWWGNGLPRR